MGWLCFSNAKQAASTLVKINQLLNFALNDARAIHSDLFQVYQTLWPYLQHPSDYMAKVLDREKIFQRLTSNHGANYHHFVFVGFGKLWESMAADADLFAGIARGKCLYPTEQKAKGCGRRMENARALVDGIDQLPSLLYLQSSFGYQVNNEKH